MNPNSDKWGSNTTDFNLPDLGDIDLNQEFEKSSLHFENLFFGKYTREEVKSMMLDSGIFTKLEERGFYDYRLEVNPISDLDNRIYVKDQNNEVLIHIRLKISDFFIKKLEESKKMVFIDWLLTQNPKLSRLKEKKKLFRGQDYPGLNIFAEITNFITIIVNKTGAYGVFNVPEYFHDAVLFKKNFRFIDPKKEGYFRSILKNLKAYSLRKLSNLIHSEKVWNVTECQLFHWSYGEMLYTVDNYLTESLFDRNYQETVAYYSNTKFSILG